MNKKVLLKIIVSVSLMGYLLSTINVQELWDSVKGAQLPILIVITFIAVPLGYLVSTIKWSILLKAQGIDRPPFLHLFALYFVGSFFSNFLPTEVGGDLMRSYRVGQISGKQIESLAATTMERVTGFSAMILLAVVGLLFNVSLSNSMRLTYIVVGVFCALVVTVILLSNREFARFIKTKIPFKNFRNILEKIESFYKRLLLYKKESHVLLSALIISIIFQFVPICYVYGLLISFGIEVSFRPLLLIIPTVSLLGILPISINSIGVREGAFVYLFTHMGVSTSESFAVSLVYRIGILLITLLGGVFYLIDSKQDRSCQNNH